MNTVKIREKYPELLQRLRLSIQDLRDWETETITAEYHLTGWSPKDIVKNKISKNLKKEYSKFLLTSIQDDLKELKNTCKKEQEVKND